MSQQSKITPEQEAAATESQVPESTGTYLTALAEKFRAHIPEEERREIPPDFAKNHRRYRKLLRKEVELSTTT